MSRSVHPRGGQDAAAPGHPRIVGPPTWPAAGSPPEFAVDTAGLPFWMVEMATARALMETDDERSADNYYFGGDAEGLFGTGDRWTVPQQAWDRLGSAGLLYYRIVAFDHGGCGGWAISVDDQHLAELPHLVVDRDRPAVQVPPPRPAPGPARDVLVHQPSSRPDRLRLGGERPA